MWLTLFTGLVPLAEAILAEIKVLTAKSAAPSNTEVQKLVNLTTFQVQVHQLMAVAAQNHLLES